MELNSVIENIFRTVYPSLYEPQEVVITEDGKAINYAIQQNTKCKKCETTDYSQEYLDWYDGYCSNCFENMPDDEFEERGLKL